jgi:hypothetical protein
MSSAVNNSKTKTTGRPPRGYRAGEKKKQDLLEIFSNIFFDIPTAEGLISRKKNN